MAESAAAPDTFSADVEWDLEPLVDGAGPDGVRALLSSAQERADALAAEFEGTVADRSAEEIVRLVEQLAELSEDIGAAGNYAMLAFSADTEDPANGALIAEVQERASRLESSLLFFELEWAALGDEQAQAVLDHPSLTEGRHHLDGIRRYRDHLLSPAEEKLLAETSPTGSSAWARLHGETLSRIRVPVPGEPGLEEPLTVILNRLSNKDRSHRKAVAEAVTESLKPELKTRAFIFNTLLQDKAIGDRLRHYPHWLASRNLANEASDASVQALVTAVKERYEVGRRWYRLKAKLLGLERLADYDRVAVVTADDAKLPWAQGRDLVLDAYRNFSPELGDKAEAFFDGYIDAAPRAGKRGGAFCAYTVPSKHPYVMMSYTGSRRDVLTLAHELGHGVHASLARPRGVFEQHTPLTVAETASVFGETLVFDRLLEQATAPADRLSLLAENIEGAIATVFRQVAMNDFEHRVHTARREEGELAVERINELWVASQTEFFGDSVEVSDGYGIWWSYVPHFVNTPGYVYAYAFGQLLALSIYKRYQDTGAGFVPAYLELLAAGGSRSPEDLGAIVGVDLADPGFWHAGLDLVEALGLQAEEAAYAARPELTRPS